ncbi:MAG: hypothetical protein ABSF45_19935 [Terriglobia bacterium]|jgi:hypothetical protein
MLKSLMRPSVKFVLTTGAAGPSAVFAVTLVSYLARSIRYGDLALLLSASMFALVTALCPYLASKRCWISDRISLFRSLGAAVPLFFVPVALFLPMVGWGDPVEHLTRGLLHHLHRALPGRWVAGSGMVAAASIAVLLIAICAWLSVSIQTKVWRSRVLLLLAGGSVVLGDVLAVGFLFLFLLEKSWVVATASVLLVFGFGAAYALAIMLNHVALPWSRAIAPLGCAILLFGLGASAALVKSSPEQRLPEAPPRQTPDISQADAVVDTSKGWTRFPLLSDQAWSWTTTPRPITGDRTFPRPAVKFGAESGRSEDKDLWFGEGEHRRLLKHFNCAEINLYQISEDRVLAIGCTQLEVFDLQGKWIGGADFVWPTVRFVALSHDHRRFAVNVFLVGVGDPPHLEEETIVIYDTVNAVPALSVKLDPLPPPDSWAAMSPDASLLAIGAGPKLRIYQLPPNANMPP